MPRTKAAMVEPLSGAARRWRARRGRNSDGGRGERPATAPTAPRVIGRPPAASRSSESTRLASPRPARTLERQFLCRPRSLRDMSEATWPALKRYYRRVRRGCVRRDRGFSVCNAQQQVTQMEPVSILQDQLQRNDDQYMRPPQRKCRACWRGACDRRKDEAETADHAVRNGTQRVELEPRGSYVRRGNIRWMSVTMDIPKSGA